MKNGEEIVREETEDQAGDRHSKQATKNNPLHCPSSREFFPLLVLSSIALSRTT